MVYPLRGADGIFRAFLTRVTTICDEHGKIVRWVGTNVDITGQLQAEAMVVQKDAMLRAAFRQTYSFMVLLSADGTILEANDAALQAIAADREDILGLKLWEAAWWSALPKEVAALQNSVARAAHGETVREECRYLLSNGSIRFAERSLSPVKGENGAITMVVATGLDITERLELRHTLEDRVQRRTQDLEEKNKQLRELSGRLLRTQDDERRRLARDLHDSVGQMLAALGMNVGVVLKQIDSLTPDAQAAVRHNQEILQRIISKDAGRCKSFFSHSSGRLNTLRRRRMDGVCFLSVRSSASP